MKDIRDMEGKIIDTRMNDLRIYEGRCPTLRAQRDGVLYVKNHTIYQLTGYETLLLQGFPKEYAKFDVIVEYFIVSGKYNIFDINEVLFKYDQPLLGG